MFSKLLKRMRVTGPLVVVAVVTALTVAGVPAVAGPVAETAGVPKKVVKVVKRALGLSKKANRRATVALRTARRGGEAGPQGPAGPAGPRGLRGLKGDRGGDGSNGTSVTGSPVGPSAECPAGGVEYTAANGTELVCDGEDGEPGEPGQPGQPGQPGEDGVLWTEGGTLPGGATLTGTWAFGPTPVAFLNGPKVPISFVLPLETPLDADDTQVVAAGEAGDDYPGKCDGGTVEDPRAEPGFLCVYVNSLFAATAGTIQKPSGAVGTGTVGAVLTFVNSDENTQGRGTWAVTAP